MQDGPKHALPKHVLIVNQHGDNRGDEAAMLGVFEALADQLGAVRFTVLHQFNDPEESSKTGGHDVEFLPLAPRDVRLVRLALASVLLVLRLPWRAVGGAHSAAVFDAYQSADLVVSAPGGPYFGELYAWHEPLHWGYALLARVFRKPLFLYAPSSGPFERWWLAPPRRYVLRQFRSLVVREERSAQYLRGLLGAKSPAIEVTIDAALGVDVEPLPRDAWPGGPLRSDVKIVGVSVLDYRYPDAEDPDAARARHDDAVVAALEFLAERIEPIHVVFMPQVHGKHHDGPYLERLAARLPKSISNEVLPDGVESRVQQRIFAAADLVIAGRYHPAVFSVLGAVPVACIAYEHKSTGMMETAGLGEFVVPINEVTTERLVKLVDAVVADADPIRNRLRAVRPQLRAKSRRTAELAVAAMST